ncbi:hypothetical protein BDR26DRAFT_837521 [Obelidium mucronatum]|nr:hypothetical protein BDR26DRAFT_837521 [Obelidium mucronatum]
MGGFNSPYGGTMSPLSIQPQQMQFQSLGMMQQQQQQQQPALFPQTFPSPPFHVGQPVQPMHQFNPPQSQPLQTLPTSSNDIWNFDTLSSGLTSSVNGVSTSQQQQQQDTMSDPFGLGFSAPPSKSNGIGPPATTSVEMNNDDQDDPFGILTGKPTPIKSKPPPPEVETNSPVTPPPRQANSTAPLSTSSNHSRFSSNVSSGSYPSSAPSTPSRDAQIAMIVDMGFDAESASSALVASGGDVQEAITLLISNKEAVEASNRNQRPSNDWPSRDDYRSAGGSNSGSSGSGWMEGGTTTTTAAVLNNAKSFLQFGRQKVLQVYEKASEKVAAVVEGLDSGLPGAAAGRQQQPQQERWGADAYASSTSPRFRDDSSDDDDEEIEVPLERKSRNNNNTLPAAGVSPRGRSPITSSLKLNSASSRLSPALSREGSNSPQRHVQFIGDPTSNSNTNADFFNNSNTPLPTPLTTVQSPPKPPKPTSSATSHQLTVSTQHKETGNAHFKTGQYSQAEESYTLAIQALPQNDPACIPLYNNRAATRLKTGDYKGAIEDCDWVLQMDREDSKALLRRATAWEGREKWAEAVKDYELLVGLGVGDGVVVRQGLARAKKGLEIQSGGSTGTSGGGGSGAGGTGSGSSPAVVASKSAIEDLAFLGGSSVGVSVAAVAPTKPMSQAAARAVEKAVESLRAQNESQEREEDEKFQCKEAIDARIDAWKRGKETNLRALLSSLDSVLWKELGWTTINLSELITPQQVKIRYMKAVAKVHPDKLKQGTTVEQKLIANEVFGALNKAWDAFKLQSGM